MRKFFILLASLLFLASCSQTEKIPETSYKQDNLEPTAVFIELDTSPGALTRVDTITNTAVVTSINLETRMIGLRNSEGKEFEVHAEDDIKNLPLVKVGDKLTVNFKRVVKGKILEEKDGIRKREETMKTERAPLGELPAGKVRHEVYAVADVVAVDKKAKTVTLRGINDKLIKFNVRNPAHLHVLKPGQQVEIDYEESVAISVNRM